MTVQAAGGPRRVLVVEDDRDVALVCRLHLEGAGFLVDEAYDATTGLSMVRSPLPAVVVLDHQLPDLDGIEVLHRLKADPRTADIPVVMVTARTHQRDRAAAWAAGVCDYLTKPFDGHRLVDAVTSAASRDPEVRREVALRELEDAEHERRAVLAAVVRDAEDAVVGLSLDGEVTYLNHAAERLYGWLEAEMLGSSVTILSHPDRHADLTALLARIAAGEPVPPFETVALQREGGERHVSVRLSPVRDEEGEVVGASALVRDVTARVREEERVERKFKSLLDAAPDAMVVVDEDGVIQLANAQAESLFGYEHDALVGRSVELLVPPRFRGRHPHLRQGYAQHPRTRGMGAGTELFALRADGSEFPVEISLSPLVSGAPGIGRTSYAAAVRDVTRRKHTEARFRGLLEAAPDAIVGVDPTGRIVLVNEQVERLFGYTRDELVGQQVEVLVPEGLRAGHPAHRDRHSADPRRRETGHGLELVARRKDGTQFPAEISLSSIDTPEGRLVSAAIRDVTARKQAEERFRAVVEAAPDAMVVVGPDGRISQLNQQTTRLFGYSPEELVGQPVEVLIPQRFRHHHPDNRDEFARRPRLRPMGAGLELWGLRKDGTEVAIEISLSPLETERGVVTSAWIRDVTTRRRGEEVQALAFEREREATARLLEVDRLRSDFLSTVSHELRTPLTAIKGFSEYLVNTWDSIPGDRRRDMVTRILNAGGRLDFLIQDLLDFSRLERGQLQVELVDHDLTDIVRETLHHAAPSMERHRLDLSLDQDARVLADRKALVRVIENLLTNAAKFSPGGSTIHVHSEVEPGEVRLVVRDEGVGIPREDQEKVFDRFYRVSEHAVRHPGTGIGLAIVKQFVEAQGGTVTLDSAPGRGSTFALHLRPAALSVPVPRRQAAT